MEQEFWCGFREHREILPSPERYLIFLFDAEVMTWNQVVHNKTGLQVFKTEQIPYKSNLENCIHIYLTILGI